MTRADRDRQSRLSERVRLATRHHWVVTAGCALAIFQAFLVAPGRLNGLLALATLVVALNGLVVVYLRTYAQRGRTLLWPGEAEALVPAQLGFNVIVAAVLIHLTGGAESFLGCIYLVMVPASALLLSRRATFALATSCLASLVTLFGLEYTGVLPHYHMIPGIEMGLYRQGSFMAIQLGLQALFLFLGAYIAGHVSLRLYVQVARRETIAQLSRRISSILDLDRLLTETVELVHQAYGYYSVAILLVDEQAGDLVSRAATGRADAKFPTQYRQALGEGMIGWVGQSGKPLLSNDVRLEARYMAYLPDTRSELTLPLKHGEHVLGVLDLQSDRRDAFGEEDLLTLQVLADQVGVAIQNARLYSGQEEAEAVLRRRADELSVLHQTALAGTEAQDADELIRRITDVLATGLYHENVGVLLLDVDTGRLRPHPSYFGVPLPLREIVVPLGTGICGTVAETGAPLLIPDVHQDPRYLNVSPTVRSELCVPVSVGEQIVGVINVESPDVASFSGEDLQLVSTVAQHVGSALGRLRLWEETRRRNEELAARNAIARAVTRSLDIDDILERLHTEVDRLLRPDTFFVAIHNPQDETFDVPLIVEQGERLPRFSARLGEAGGLTSWVIRECRPLLVRDMTLQIDELPASPQQIAETEPSRSWLGVPLVARGSVVGVLSVQCFRPMAFDNADQGFLSGVADHVAMAVDNARLYEKTRQMAVTDGLTGLFNSRYFYAALERELARGERYRYPISLVMLDLDDFKRYNDRYGHLAGDDLLKELACVIAGVIRRTDVAARYGGEEFAIILPQATTDDAAMLAGRLREAAGLNEFRVQNEAAPSRITVSLGTATYPTDAGDAKGLVHCADMALLAAKKSKNTVCVYPP